MRMIIAPSTFVNSFCGTYQELSSLPLETYLHLIQKLCASLRGCQLIHGSNTIFKDTETHSKHSTIIVSSCMTISWVYFSDSQSPFWLPYSVVSVQQATATKYLVPTVRNSLHVAWRIMIQHTSWCFVQLTSSGTSWRTVQIAIGWRNNWMISKQSGLQRAHFVLNVLYERCFDIECSYNMHFQRLFILNIFLSHWNVLVPLCSQLRDAFVYQLTQGYSHFDRQLRNDILVIASLTASVNAELPFIQTGFAKQLALLATFQEGL